MNINKRKVPVNETTQDVPIILNPELRDVFPIFVNMLDIKSFMKLAMTSKGMYKRCMEDKSVRINVDEDCVYGYDSDNVYLNSSLVLHHHTQSYLFFLKKMRCTVNLGTFEIRSYFQIISPSPIIEPARQYLAKINIKRIEKFSLYTLLNEWNAVILFIKDFHVNVLAINDRRTNLPAPVLRSLLQLNLKSFYYDGPVPVDLLFEIDSPIRKISLIGINNIPNDKFMQILWMIQSGCLTHLTFNINAVDWSTYDKLPFHHQGPIPDDRPLLFARTPQRSEIYEYWFLHWQGGVTKCVTNNTSRTLKVFKCEESDLPLALRKKEDILKDLSEMRSGVSCLHKHFRKFSEKFTMLDRSLKGPLPTDRPLFVKDSENSFWLLDENDDLMKCIWENGCANWYDRHKPPSGYPALSKYMFWNLLKKNTRFCFDCKSSKEFDSWFEGYKTFDFDYIGPLPDERPLVFGRGDSQTRVVLFDDFSFICQRLHDRMYAKHCVDLISSASGISAKDIRKMLQDTSKEFRNAFVNIRVSLKTFRDGLKLFESDSDPFVWKLTRQIDGILMDEYYYSIRGTVMKVVWKEGRLMRTPGDLREFPFEFTKMLFKEFARQGKCMDTVFLDLKQFESCLKQFTVVPFDYSGTLKIEYPLAFTKKEIYHTCHEKDSKCQCSDVIIHVRFLWEDMTSSTHCSWGGEEPQKISFFTMPDRSENVPSAMKTKEYLQMLLETDYDSETQYEWFGEIDDFLVFFDDFKKFPFDYKGRLPKERPLVFENNSIANEPVRFFLRENNSVVKCKWSAMTRKEAHFSLPKSKRRAPRATWKFL